MKQSDVLDRLRGLRLPDPDSLNLGDAIAIYEALRPIMPQAPDVQTRMRDRLVDIMDEVDALIFDGYGVINVGNGPIAGIHEVFAVAASKNVPIVVLTNGASFDAERVWQKYVGWDLPIARNHVVSSRDALEVALRNRDQVVLGTFSAVAQPLAHPNLLHYGADPDLFEKADEFVFLGTIGWKDDDQQSLETALLKRKRMVHIANPDVASPQASGFSSEPGYWAARTMQSTGAPISWYGKPHGPAFDLAFSRLESVMGRRYDKGRVAMVGDSLHTDIIGAAGFGLRTVLLTDYGLFRDGGAREMVEACGIRPDWIVQRL